ncbi:B-block binding subunit of TFIIIC [Pyrolobus fumarii 1A]|uniref:B-block binding subunit of TFIIIC n=1 Tax=Pyrolobus fumarii (strain DSM 11204 / 1A) TaxID=694429 RepID=G0EGX9_PYRF1|nr:TFIIIC protein [Pyrolobus fumarii]AEM38429.1 B-block binding subunit of TFIIIC [Pyrolobus fumarii 1A]
MAISEEHRPSLSELEQKALEIIKSRGKEGIYQHELWKLLGIDSREGSRLALRLYKKGLIVREPAVHRGHRTYKLYLAKPGSTTPRSFKMDVSLNVAIEVPCFTCLYLHECYTGGFHDPRKCPRLSIWLTSKTEERERR